MGLTRLAIARPVAIMMLLGAFVVLGVYAFFKLPAELNPQVDFPRITITTTYAGTNPADMETLITKPIEDAISGVSGVKQIVSSSQQGISVVSVQFYFGTDLNSADADVIQKVDAARKLLPTDADSPAVLKADTSSQPVIYYALRSDRRSTTELNTIATNIVQPAFEQAASVGAVTITGGAIREIRILVSQQRLAAYGITITQLADVLQAANVNVASGFVQRSSQYYDVRIVGEFSTVDEIRKVRLNVGSTQFFLSDVANVVDGQQDLTADALVNGSEAVTLVVQKTTDGNTLEAARGVKQAVIQLKQQLPSDIEFIPVIDLSTNVESNLHDVVVSLFLGSSMAILVVFLFLHNVRGTVIVALALPTSMIATFFPIQLLGYSLNTMTLLGLSLAVGILVDDSIVVLENINRHLALGEEPTVAAINGRTEIGLAAITLTSVDLAVFLPIGFMGGVIGEFFRSFGITVAIATLFSLLVSFTLTPMLAARWYKKGQTMHFTRGFAGAFDRGFFAFENWYQRVLRQAIKHPYLVVLFSTVILVGTIFVMAPLVGFRFAPDQDQNQVAVSIQGPAGTSLDSTRGIVKQIDNIITSTPDLAHDTKYRFVDIGHSQSGGQGTSSFTGTQYANMSLLLYDRKSILDWLVFSREHLRNRSDKDVALEIRKLTQGIRGARIIATNVSGFSGSAAPLEVDVTGSDFSVITNAALKIQALFKKTKGVYDTDISYKPSQPEIQVRLDRTKATEYGLSLSQVANAVADAVQGNINSEFRDPNSGQQYYMRVQLTDISRDDPNKMLGLIVGYQNGSPIYLSDVAQVSVGAGPVKIDRLNREREIAVTGYLLTGYQIGGISTALRRQLTTMQANGDLGAVQFTFGGEAQSLSDEGIYMITAFLLGIILSYMLMAALFNNALYPLSIMLSLPQAWAGAIIALYLAGQPLNLIAMIGVVLLNGIVNKNAILVVDFTNTLRRRGFMRNDAILQAAPTRLRLIMMTTIAILVSSLPTALALGRGSTFRQSLGITVLGGASLSMFLTLLIIPCAYIVWDDLAHPSYLFRRITGRSRKPGTGGSDYGKPANGHTGPRDGAFNDDILERPIEPGETETRLR